MTRTRLWLFGFLLPLALVAASIYPMPNEVHGQLGNVAAIAPTTKEQAKREREQFEAKRGTIDLQPREYVFDRAAQIASGTTLDGHGATVKQAYTGGEFPLNSSLIAFGANVGWIDPMTIDPKDSAVITLRNPAAAANYPAGTLLYAWGAAQAVPNPQPYGTVNQRRTVKKQSGPILTLDSPIDRRCNAVCWLPAGSVPCNNVRRGDYQITAAGRFAPGQVLWITSGKTLADELRGEWVTVEKSESGVVALRDRASRDYDTAALATIKPIENVTIRNLTIAPSLNPDGAAFCCKWIRNWRFEDCTFGGLSGIGGATDVTFVRCRTLAKGWQLNTTTRVSLRDCTMPAISTDEADADVTIRDCLFAKAIENAVRTGLDTERMTVAGCTIVDPFYAPFAFGGRDCRIENCRIYARGHHSWLAGDNLVVRDVRSDGPLVFQGGRAIRLDRVAATELHFGWVVGGPTQGTYHDCTPTPTVHSTANLRRE